MKILTLAICLLLLCNAVYSQPLKARGKYIVDKHGDEIILRGIGLGGWMLQEPYMLQLSGIAIAQHDIQQKIRELAGDENAERFYDAWLENHCTKADIDSIAAWGFNAVRLPMHYNLFTLPVEKEPVKNSQTWLRKGFDLTDSLLSWCRANKIYLILDLHAAPGGQGNDNAIADRDTSKPSLWESELNRQKTVALWQELAKRYANEEWIGGYDVINEPNWGFESLNDKNGCAEKKNEPLTKLLKEITAAIRKVDKEHIIIIEGNCWGNNYENMFPLWDDNMVISFHKYWNYTDQHSIQKFLDYRERYNIPVWMGESGENSNAWFTDAIQLLERNKIGWAWWPLKKSGINNPMQVKLNEDYVSILEYWKGKGVKPSREKAVTGFMQLASDTRISNNIFHRDVIDAMIRQVASTALKPFKHHLINRKAIVFAVDYDLGKLHHAYYDTDIGNYWVSNNKRTEWNKGWQYRNDGVDIDHCSDTVTNGYCVGWTDDGEWLHYSVTAASEGVYNVQLRFASTTMGKAQLMINNTPAGMFDLGITGAYTTWQNSMTLPVKFEQGANTIKLFIHKGGFNLNYIEFIFQDNTANTNNR